jgi:hypothetical protein
VSGSDKSPAVGFDSILAHGESLAGLYIFQAANHWPCKVPGSVLLLAGGLPKEHPQECSFLHALRMQAFLLSRIVNS